VASKTTKSIVIFIHVIFL